MKVTVKRIKPKNLTFTVLKSMSVRNAKSVRESNMKEHLLALEKKLRDDIFEFANENNNKSVEEILTMLGIKEYTLKDGVYHFTTYEIDTNDLVHMTYEKDRLHVLYTKGVEVVNIDNTFFCPTGAELIIEILFATTYRKDLVRAMMVAVGRATE